MTYTFQEPVGVNSFEVYFLALMTKLSHFSLGREKKNKNFIPFLYFKAV